MNSNPTIEQRIEKALIRYLKASRGIDSIYAEFGETDTSDWDSGCDTCGWGSQDISFEIYYKKEGDSGSRSATVSGDPLQFLPTLFKYDVDG